MSELVYKDALGNEIKKGDTIVYIIDVDRGLQIGRVLELSSQRGWGNTTIPALKIQGAKSASWKAGGGFEKLSRPSTITKLWNVVVVNGNLSAIVALM